MLRLLLVAVISTAIVGGWLFIMTSILESNRIKRKKLTGLVITGICMLMVISEIKLFSEISVSYIQSYDFCMVDEGVPWTFSENNGYYIINIAGEERHFKKEKVELKYDLYGATMCPRVNKLEKVYSLPNFNPFSKNKSWEIFIDKYIIIHLPNDYSYHEQNARAKIKFFALAFFI